MTTTASRTSTPFHYSDGEEVENRILGILQSASDLASGSPELAGAVSDWSTLIHFSADRRNLLIPVCDLLRGSILELGAGCGALTRFLGETGTGVTAIEGSARRSEAARARCRDLPNVRIVNEPFLHWETVDRFDTVLGIGFLEYSRLYSEAEDPVGDTLRRIGDLLAPGGALILAIENQVGLKYLAGDPEDHAGEPYFGVNDRYGRNTPVTFGKTELENILRHSGFRHVQFSYAFPDYKLPSLIVESAAVGHAQLDLAVILRDTLPRRRTQNGPALDQAAAFSVLLRNGLLGDLANSFLIVARKQPGESAPPERRPLVHLFSTNRSPHFQKVTVFEESATGIVVRREALSGAPPVSGSAWHRRFENEAYMPGLPWIAGLEAIVRHDGWTIENVAAWARPWILFLRSNCLDEEPSRLPPHFTDCTPFNVLQDAHGDFRAFDLEYESSGPVDIDAVVFRGLWQSLARIPRCAAPDASVPHAKLDVVTSIMAKCDMAIGQNRVNELILQEAELQAAVRGLPQDGTLRAFAVERLPVPSGAVHRPRSDASYVCQVFWRSDNEPYDESRSSTVGLNATRVMQRLDLPIPPLGSVNGLRLDLADRTGVVEVAAITLTDVRGHQIRNWTASEIAAATSSGMRCVPNGGNYEGVTAFMFTDDPFLELPLDSSVAVGCLRGGLLRVVCRWPAEDDPAEPVLRRATELFRVADARTRDLQAEIVQFNQRLERMAEEIARIDDIKAEVARISEAHGRPGFWWKRST